MTDHAAYLASLKRPRILVRAALHGLSDYDRNRCLRRVLSGVTLSPASAVARLLDIEEALETARKAGEAGYSPARHVDVMIALMAEVRLLSRGDSEG